jgi:hypothetical protein
MIAGVWRDMAADSATQDLAAKVNLELAAKVTEELIHELDTTRSQRDVALAELRSLRDGRG